jgi:hypothetical protein
LSTEIVHQPEHNHCSTVIPTIYEAAPFAKISRLLNALTLRKEIDLSQSDLEIIPFEQNLFFITGFGFVKLRIRLL